MAKRTDRNHAACRDALRECGWLVDDTFEIGRGFVDFIAIKGGRVVFVEVKDGTKPPSERRLTSAEAGVHQRLRAAGADVYVMTDATDLSYFERPRTSRLSYDDVQVGRRDTSRPERTR